MKQSKTQINGLKFNTSIITKNTLKLQHNAMPWREAVKVIEELPFNIGGKEITLLFDWQNSALLIDRYINLIEEQNQKITNSPNILNETLGNIFGPQIETHFRRNNDIKLAVSSTTSEDQHFDGLITSALHELFVALNLSQIGCANFKSVHFGSLDNHGRETIHSLNLSSESDSLAHDFQLKYGWPSITSIDFKIVWQWLQKIDLRNIKVAQTNTQRALYALMHASNVNVLGTPIELLWLTLGLEALFDTPRSGILSALKNRIFALHSPIHQNEVGHLTKKINSLYDIRSKIVHGTFPFFHPAKHNIFIDDLSEHETLFDSIQLVRIILFSTFQKMIINNWIQLEFETKTIIKGIL